MEIARMQMQYTGTNIEAFTVYVYYDSFWITAQKQLTGITSKIRIDRLTRNISQFDAQQHIPADPDNKILCSSLMGILPIYNKHYLLLAQLVKNVCQIQKHNIYELQKMIFLPFEHKNEDQLPTTPRSGKFEGTDQKIYNIIQYLKLSLLFEGYYFSFRYNLSLSRQSFAIGSTSKRKFFWNHRIGRHFSKLEDSKWFIGIIQGSIRSFSMTIQGTVIKYILITRRSWVKGGTRFNARGIDVQGNVANFCETEQLLFARNICFSHLIIRGSVPLFWKQTGINQAVQIDINGERNQQAFKRHMDKLIAHYQKVFCVNLLCLDKKGEDDLTYGYQKLVKDTGYKDLRYQFFDVHCAAKGQKFQHCNYLVTQKLHGIIKSFGHYQQDTTDTGTVNALQNGIIRVNCLDSLDRTNLIQSKIAYHALNIMLDKLGLDIKKVTGERSVLIATDNINNSNVFVIHLKNVWADNGDMISKHYTGTGSTHTNVTRAGKRNLKGLFDHGLKSCMRFYQQFVDDNIKQQAIDVLLCDHTQTANLEEIAQRFKDFESQEYANFSDMENIWG